MGALGGSEGVIFVILGATWSILGSWDDLEASWRVFERLGEVLVAPWENFGRFCQFLGVYFRVGKNI